MTKLALFVRLEAKPGQEAALADFLASALPLANAESGTTALMANAETLLSSPPNIEKVELLAAKLPA
jgi:quinol monooxygenase YgiN